MAVLRPPVNLYRVAVSQQNHLRVSTQLATLKTSNQPHLQLNENTRRAPGRPGSEKRKVNQVDIQKQCKHPTSIDLRFSNAQEAYRSKCTSELVRALLVFNLCSISYLVDNQKTLLKWARKVLGKRLFAALMQQTFYGHFVAGEDERAITPLVTRNRAFGVKSILDYSAEKDLSQEQAVHAEIKGCAPENHPSRVHAAAQFQVQREFCDRRQKVTSVRTYFYTDEKQCDENMDIFLGCVDAVSDATEKSGFAAVKLTALGKPQLLLQMSAVLTSVKNFFFLYRGMSSCEYQTGDRRFHLEDFDKRLMEIGVLFRDKKASNRVSIMDISNNQEIDLLDWHNLLEINRSLSKLFVVPDLKTGQLRPLVETLSEEEEERMKNMLKRINTIAKYASQKGVRIMIDAEQTYFQPAISRLTVEMMKKFNKERSVVYNTYQCYLKQILPTIVVDLDLAERENFCFGAKLVRGAYMEQERERALRVGYEDPINMTYDETTAMYHKVMAEVMHQISLREPGKITIMIATHNEDSIREAVELMKMHGIGPQDHIVSFGQLLGMCDHISFPLGQAGYSVYKYVPYGPVDEVLPYLSRRAMENRGVLKKVIKEKQLLYQELVRRIKSRQLYYDPESHIPGKP